MGRLFHTVLSFHWRLAYADRSYCVSLFSCYFFTQKSKSFFAAAKPSFLSSFSSHTFGNGITFGFVPRLRHNCRCFIQNGTWRKRIGWTNKVTTAGYHNSLPCNKSQHQFSESVWIEMKETKAWLLRKSFCFFAWKNNNWISWHNKIYQHTQGVNETKRRQKPTCP